MDDLANDFYNQKNENEQQRRKEIVFFAMFCNYFYGVIFKIYSLRYGNWQLCKNCCKTTFFFVLP